MAHVGTTASTSQFSLPWIEAPPAFSHIRASSSQVVPQSGEGLAIAVRALLGRLDQNFHFLLQATAQLIFLDLKIMVGLEVQPEAL